MRVLKDHKGFSLVELVVVAGLVAILAGISLQLIGHIGSANIEKSTKYVTDALSKQQMRSMSKENKPYLYIYEYNGKKYFIISEETAYNSSTMGSKGTEIGNAEITYNNGSDHTVDSANVLKISYKKDGSFKECPNTITITVGSNSRTITLNKETGRHVVD